MVQFGNNDHIMWQGTPVNRTAQNQPTRVAAVLSSEEDIVADVDEPPDLERTPRPSVLKLHESFRASFTKRVPVPAPLDRKESLLTNALHSNENSPVEETTENDALRRGMSCASFWSSNSASTAELTSDDGITSPNTRSRTPSPPLPPTTFHNMVPILNKNIFREPVSIVRPDEDHIGPLQKAPNSNPKEDNVEVTLGRRRCITFACGDRKEPPKPAEATKPEPKVEQNAEPAKRVPTIKFACPSKISTDGPSMGNKSRVGRNKSPAPRAQVPLGSFKTAQKNTGASSRSKSPIDAKAQALIKDRARRLSTNPELGKTEAYRFHEFASSEEEVDEWVQESTCHRSRLTITDTLKIENGLRQLGEEAEEEALDDEDDEDQDDDIVDADLDDDDDDDDEDNLDDEDAEEDYVSDEGFQTDDEEGFAGSDDDSDAGSDFAWWAPGADSTAATSVEYLDHIRPSNNRTGSVSSIETTESHSATRQPKRTGKARKTRPVNIRVPSPELPDSTDFVCGTLDEDRPLEQAYMSCLERRRAAKRKLTPQDIDPTFPTSDPEMDEEDEDDDEEELAIQRSVRAIHAFHEGDHNPMMVGQMDQLDQEARGRTKAPGKRSPALSPKRMRSPPPPSKRAVHRSPAPRKLFGQSPKRLRSPAPVGRLRSPPPTRRGSANVVPTRRIMPTVRFGGLAERPVPMTSSSLPRTPVTAHEAEDYYDDEDTACEMPVRRAIDIKVGLEKKRQRRKEQQYRKLHRKNNKDKRPPPGKGAERMREMGLGLAAHKGKNVGFAFGIPPTPDQKDIHVLSV